MSTAAIEPDSTIELNDFHSKKIALANGIGFGWMPRYLVESELRRGTLRIVRWTGAHTHDFRPFLYHRGANRLGRAGRLFIEGLQKEFTERDESRAR